MLCPLTKKKIEIYLSAVQVQIGLPIWVMEDYYLFSLDYTKVPT